MKKYTEDQIRKAVEDVKGHQMDGFLYQEPTSKRSGGRSGSRNKSRSHSRNRSCSCQSRSKNRSRSCQSRSKNRFRSCRSRKNDRCRSRRRGRVCTEDVFNPSRQTRYWDEGNMYLLHQKK